jgi:hypothetical protein
VKARQKGSSGSAKQAALIRAAEHVHGPGAVPAGMNVRRGATAPTSPSKLQYLDGDFQSSSSLMHVQGGEETRAATAAGSSTRARIQLDPLPDAETHKAKQAAILKAESSKVPVSLLTSPNAPKQRQLKPLAPPPRSAGSKP